MDNCFLITSSCLFSSNISGKSGTLWRWYLCGKLLIDENMFHCPQASAAVDIYNYSSNTWTTASLSQARQYLAATFVGNLSLFAGGDNDNGVSFD